MNMIKAITAAKQTNEAASKAVKKTIDGDGKVGFEDAMKNMSLDEKSVPIASSSSKNTLTQMGNQNNNKIN